MRTFDKLIRDASEKALTNLRNNGNKQTIDDIRSEMFRQAWLAIDAYNAVAGKGGKFKQVQCLTNFQVAYAISQTQKVCRIQCAGTSANEDLCLLAVYQESGPKEGLYDGDGPALRRLVRAFNSEATKKDVAEVEDMLRDMVPLKKRTTDQNLVPVNNGIFNYETKQLLPFSPDFVFLSKVCVDYNPNASNPIMHNPNDGTDWDIESWMNELFDDGEVVDLIWKIIGACVRPYVRWDRTAWFYSYTGNSGKGTLLTLMKALIGEGNYVSVKLSEMDKDFALEELIHATCILTDENNVGEYIDKSSNMKAIATGDTMQINRKNKSLITFRFWGFSVQCLNEIPRVRDRTSSLARRCLIIRFEHCFNGRERKYIKDKYLVDPSVLEYVLYKVLTLMPDYYTLPQPEACAIMLEQFKSANNPVLEFMREMFPCLVWNVVPFDFIYSLYRSWMVKNNPSGGTMGKYSFINELLEQLPGLGEELGWYYPGHDKSGRHRKITVGDAMNEPEPLILTYDLNDFKNKLYHGNDPNLICRPIIPVRTTGLIRAGYTVQEEKAEKAG